jgi:hypothetical protein
MTTDKLKLDNARNVIVALVQGNDPESGTLLPTDNILNRADGLRALLIASSSIEDAIARANRRAQLPGNVGRNWSKEEEATMVAAFNSGDPIPHIAARHGRTIRAIEARLERLGLLKPEDRVTNNSFVSAPPPGKKGEKRA